MDILLDPNVAYVLLVFGLMLAIMAVFTPGTGVIEITALFALALAGYANMHLRRFDDVLALLDATPGDQTAAVLPQLAKRLNDAPSQLVDPLRGWLHGRVAQRGPDWQSAYALLASLERELARTQGGAN